MFSVRCIAATVAASFIVVMPAAAGASAAQAALQELTGTWTCVSHSSDSTTFRETDTNTMYGNWLRTSSAFAAQAGAPGGTGVSFIGYDVKKARWVITGVDTNGSYFTAASSSPDLDGSVWMDTYPADNGGAVLHLVSATQYILDSHGPGPQGTMTTSHTVCNK